MVTWPSASVCVVRSPRHDRRDLVLEQVSGLSFSYCPSVRSMVLIYASLHNSRPPDGLNVFMGLLPGINLIVIKIQ